MIFFSLHLKCVLFVCIHAMLKAILYRNYVYGYEKGLLLYRHFKGDESKKLF